MITKLKSLQSHQGFIRYFKNTSWLFAEKFFRMVVGFFVGIWVVRYLGPEQFGLFSYAHSFVGLFTAIATLGLDSIVVRELVKDESRRDEIIGTAFWLKIMGAVGVLLLLAIAVNFISNDIHTNTLVFIIASATIFQSFNVVDMYFQSKVMSRYVVYANIISLSISSIVKIVLILNDATLVAFAWVVLFDSIVLSIGFIYFYINSNLSLKVWRFNFKLSRKLLKSSYPLIFSSLFISIYMKIDQVMIGEYLGVYSVGLYAATIKLILAVNFIGSVIVKSLFPSLINSINNIKETRYKFEKIFQLLSIIGLAFTAFFILFSERIITIVYGDNYSGASEIMYFYSFTIVFVYFGLVTSQYLIASHSESLIMYRMMMGAFINVVLNIVLIQAYGLIGAAIATLAAQIFTSVAFNLFNTKTRFLFLIQLKSIFLLNIK
jgi:O-antigen/teichoic acid export membrane protein